MNIAVALPAQQKRVRALVVLYRDSSLKGAGDLAADLMDAALERAELAAAAPDVIEMVCAYSALREFT